MLTSLPTRRRWLSPRAKEIIWKVLEDYVRAHHGRLCNTMQDRASEGENEIIVFLWNAR